MTKIHKIYSNNYTVVDNTILRDSRLSLQAWGLFVYCWSMPDDWTFYESELMNHFKNKISSTQSARKELEKYGYLKRKRLRDAKGKFTDTDWILIPNPTLDFPTLEKPTLEKPTLENQQLLNTNNTKYLYKQSTNNTNIWSTDVDQVSKDSKFNKEFEELWKLYPKKQGKKDALRHYKAWRKKDSKKEPHTFEVMKDKLSKYLQYVRVKGYTTEYIQKGSTWFNGRFDDELDLTPTKPKGYSQPRYVEQATDWDTKAKEATQSKPKLSQEEIQKVFKEFDKRDGFSM